MATRTCIPVSRSDLDVIWVLVKPDNKILVRTCVSMTILHTTLLWPLPVEHHQVTLLSQLPIVLCLSEHTWRFLCRSSRALPESQSADCQAYLMWNLSSLQMRECGGRDKTGTQSLAVHIAKDHSALWSNRMRAKQDDDITCTRTQWRSQPDKDVNQGWAALQASEPSRAWLDPGTVHWVCVVPFAKWSIEKSEMSSIQTGTECTTARQGVAAKGLAWSPEAMSELRQQNARQDVNEVTWRLGDIISLFIIIHIDCIPYHTNLSKIWYDVCLENAPYTTQAVELFNPQKTSTKIS